MFKKELWKQTHKSTFEFTIQTTASCFISSGHIVLVDDNVPITFIQQENMQIYTLLFLLYFIYFLHICCFITICYLFFFFQQFSYYFSVFTNAKILEILKLILSFSHQKRDMHVFTIISYCLISYKVIIDIRWYF